MNAVEKTQSWRSIHTDYLGFAVSAYRDCQEKALAKTADMNLHHHAIDTIRYSYDCFESSVEFVYHMGRLKQLRISVPSNWLTRYIERNWKNLSLSDRIGFLAYVWADKQFWLTESQISLFQEWKKVRDGLTHPVPFGTELEQEILMRQELEDGSTLTQSRLVSLPKQISGDSMTFSSHKAIAQFSRDPSSLGKEDAAKALEILLHHLVKLEDMFFGGRSTWFSFYESTTNSISTTTDLLKMMICRFDKVWS